MIATEDRGPASIVLKAFRLAGGIDAAPGFAVIGASVPSKSTDTKT